MDQRSMRVRLYEASDKDKWDEYVKRSPDSSVYHLSGWKDVIERSFGKRCRYLLAEDSQHTIHGILPLVHLQSVFFGNFMVSLPYFNYGGICVDHPIAGRQLLETAIEMARGEDVDHIELRDIRRDENGLAVKASKVSMRLNLPSASDELRTTFPSKLRSQIRRPEREGMYARIGKEDELASFYKVFSTNMRDLGTPCYSKAFFQTILEVFPDSTWICTIYWKNEAVASGFVVGCRDTLEIPWASSLRRFNLYSPNMLLYWSLIEFACERGYRVFDFGRSTPGEGTYRFKEQWGARPVELYWHYWLRKEGPLPDISPRNPKYRLAIAIWRRLPVALTAMVGPAIVKNLP